MSEFKIDFDSLDWQSPRPGMRFKLYREGSRQLRLVEFLNGDVEPYWCEESHIGIVLKGALQIEFPGKVVSFKEGDGVFISAGPSNAHRGTSITPGTCVLFVEDVRV
jgi:quercetin dioxygenase-like cupin family protein